jgi:hypothetical protein
MRAHCGWTKVWSMASRWRPGDTIVHHEVWRGRVWAARPLTVVEDGDDRLLLWMPHGTVRKVPAPPPGATGRERDPLGLPSEASHRGVVQNLERGGWAHTDHVWDVSTLWVLAPGAWQATWVSWLPSGEHLGWYVNFQRPYRRTATGIEAMDLMVDIVVDPDRSWRWKDRAEFEQCAARGLFDAEVVGSVQAEAAAVIAAISAARPPFSSAWPAWVPPEPWPAPALPCGWSDVPR